MVGPFEAALVGGMAGEAVGYLSAIGIMRIDTAIRNLNYSRLEKIGILKREVNYTPFAFFLTALGTIIGGYVGWVAQAFLSH